LVNWEQLINAMDLPAWLEAASPPTDDGIIPEDETCGSRVQLPRRLDNDML
jgi:hypothetical protein